MNPSDRNGRSDNFDNGFTEQRNANEFPRRGGPPCPPLVTTTTKLLDDQVVRIDGTPTSIPT